MHTQQPSGMVVVQVLDLGHRLAIGADEIDQVASRIAGRLQHLHWYGPDATRFKADVLDYLPVLQHSAQFLRALAQRAVDNARDQEAGSQSDGGLVTPLPVPAPAIGLPGGILGLPDSVWEQMGAILSIGSGPINVLIRVGGDELLIRNPLLRHFPGIGNLADGASVFFDIIDVIASGRSDAAVGQLTLDVVSWGLGAAGETMLAVGIGAALSGVAAPAAPFLIVGGGVLMLGSMGATAIGAFSDEATAAVGGFVNGAIDAAGAAVGWAWDGTRAVWNSTGPFIDGTVDAFTSALEPAQAAVSVAGEVVGDVVDFAGDAVSGAVESGKNFLKSINPF